jgi:hypothetical protein
MSAPFFDVLVKDWLSGLFPHGHKNAGLLDCKVLCEECEHRPWDDQTLKETLALSASRTGCTHENLRLACSNTGARSNEETKPLSESLMQNVQHQNLVGFN